MTDKASAQWLHTQQVVRHILRMPQCTKPQLARATGLTASAVHGIVTDLVRAQAVLSSGMAESEGGRRAVTYGLNDRLGLLLAVSLRVDRLELGVFNAKLEPLHQATLPWRIDALGPESYVSQLAQELQALIDAQSLDRASIIGVGVCLPGPVDEDGVVLEIAAAPQWQRYPMGQRLADALNLPVAADKDVYAAIRYLELSGMLRSDRCSAYLSICEGIGASLLVHGEIFRGAHALAGEIGHLTVRKDGIPCTCGNTGCLELYCSDIGIVQQYNAQANTRLTDIAQVMPLLAAGDEAARRVFSQAVGYLVETTASIIMNYDPDELLIYSTWLSQEKRLFFRMLDTLYAKSVFTRGHAVDVRLLSDAPLNLPAAATLVLDRLLLARDGYLWHLLGAVPPPVPPPARSS